MDPVGDHCSVDSIETAQHHDKGQLLLTIT
jgi:hypothetical protein